MPTNADAMSDLLVPFGPTRDLDELVVQVNEIYHDIEAVTYDRSHPEVHRQLPSKWVEMVAQLPSAQGPGFWTILDFGCGTGFEAEQLLRLLPEGTIRRIVCHDPSRGMLELCRARIAPLFPAAEFVNDLEELDREQFNLLATNSLLHHLPDPIATITGLGDLLTPDAWWLAGHEPSSRYYLNTEFVALYARYEAQQRWRRFLSPARYLRRAGVMLGLRSDPARAAAKVAVEHGLFRKRPTRVAIDRLVDFYVAHSPEEARAQRGFDAREMQRAMADSWELRWQASYSFMGPHYEDALPGNWARQARVLAERYPDDGANFCSVWERTQ